MAALLPFLFALTAAQKIGTAVPEVHPKLITQFCTAANGCVDRQTSIVIDALSRPFHAVGEADVPCSPVNSTLCPDAATCAASCELEGVEYSSVGVLTKGTALTMRQYLFDGRAFTSVSPRLYLLAPDDQNYELLKLAGQEFSYDVDVSQLGCGMNGALYLSEMDASGSRGEFNPAGAAYGTGYCDAQCFNTSFIYGMPNLNNSGACCNEMDIWEANSMATALTPHTCSGEGPFLCSGDECGETSAGVCDHDGCGLNPFRDTSDKSFYGPGSKMVDTTKPFTVVTQFVNGSSSGSQSTVAGGNSSSSAGGGALSEIRRMYVQNGKVMESPPVMMSAGGGAQSQAVETAGAVSSGFCTEKNASDFMRLGGVEGMGAALARGMVLIFSIWNSDDDFMNWLDSGESGPCGATDGDPQKILTTNPEVSITFSNIRWGDLGSTFNESGPSALEAAAVNTKASSASGPLVIEWGVWSSLAAVMGYFLL